MGSARSHGAFCTNTRSNGREALLWLEKNVDAVDAVLMDVQKPVLDGLEASRLIEADARLRHLPIVALTAGALDSERTKVHAAGMNAFRTKPLEAVELVRTPRHLITESRGRFMRLVLPSQSTHEGGAITQELCGSLHKLRGGASMLGAVGVAEEAGLSEALLKLPHQDPLPAIQKVVVELDDLIRSIDEWELRRARSVEPVGHAHSSHALGKPDDLLRLFILLQARDLDAVDLSSELGADLCAVLGPEGTDQFMERVDHLDFATAQARLMAGLVAFGVETVGVDSAQTTQASEYSSFAEQGDQSCSHQPLGS